MMIKNYDYDEDNTDDGEGDGEVKRGGCDFFNGASLKPSVTNMRYGYTAPPWWSHKATKRYDEYADFGGDNDDI